MSVLQPDQICKMVQDMLNMDSTQTSDIATVDKDLPMDELLKPNEKRFTLFPIKYPEIWKMYKKAFDSFWTPDEIVLTNDIDDWNNKLNDQERYYMKHILAFFSQADGIVNENLLLHFQQDVQILEAQYFYQFQGMIENVHAEVYGLFIETYINDPQEKEYLFNAIDNVPCVKKKADWALRWIENDKATFGERLLAFACVEGIFFSGSFAAIFWLRSRNLLPGLAQANNLIARDEGLHQSFACMLYKDYISVSKPSVEKARQIISECVDIEIEFQTEALPCRLIGINSELLTDYTRYVADRLMEMCGLETMYDVKKCPLDWMESISVQPTVNFFERRSTEYRMAVGKRGEWDLDADF